MSFLESILAFPTVLFTGALSLAAIYWAFVMAGVLDIEVLDGGADGLLDGAVEGAIDGAADGALEGATEGLDGAADGALHGKSSAGALSILGLRSVPVTVSGSFLAAYGWAASIGLSKVLEGLFGAASLLADGLALVLAFAIALPLASLSSRPLRHLFDGHTGMSRRELTGQTCVIQTDRVDQAFGQAEWKDGGTSLLLQVRCDSANGLRKGSTALIVAHDDARHAYVVEPLVS